MKGIILVNAFSGIGEHQAKRLKEEFSTFGLEVPIIRNIVGNVPVDVDFCVYLDKDPYTAIALENNGVKLFNSYQSIALCDDKMLTYLALEDRINQPLSIPASFCYSNTEVCEEELDYIESKLGFPLVLKLNKQSRGEGVFLIENREQLKEYITRFRGIPHFYQKFISFARGRDTRVIVVGNKVLCAMERVNEKDFRSNIEQGGVGRCIGINDDMQNMAVEVSKKLCLEYCGIDFVTDYDGKIYLIEVNSNAFFKGIESASGMNVARAYARRILEVLGVAF